MEVVDKISRLLLCVFEVYIFYDFTRHSMTYRDRRRIVRYSILGVLIGSIFLVNSLTCSLVNLIVVPCLFCLTCIVLYDAKLRTKIFNVFFYYTVTASIEIIFDFWFSNLNETKNEQVFYPSYNSILILLIEKTIAFMLLRISQLLSRNTKQYAKEKVFWSFFILPFSSFLIYAGILYSKIDFQAFNFSKLVLIIGCFCLIFSNVFVFYLFEKLSVTMSRTKELEVLRMKTDMEKKHYEQLEILNQEHLKHFHDMKHYLKAIGSLTKQEENDKVLKILEELNIWTENINNSNFCGHSVVNAILSERKNQAKGAKLQYDVKVEPNLIFNHISDIDLISMMGNLMDNAIESAEKCKEDGFVDVHIYMANESFLIVQIQNNFRTKPQRIGDSFLTLKTNKEKHGFGISNVKVLASKYGGFLQTEVIDNVFTASLILSVEE